MPHLLPHVFTLRGTQQPPWGGDSKHLCSHLSFPRQGVSWGRQKPKGKPKIAAMIATIPAFFGLDDNNKTCLGENFYLQSLPTLSAFPPPLSSWIKYAACLLMKNEKTDCLKVSIAYKVLHDYYCDYGLSGDPHDQGVV